MRLLCYPTTNVRPTIVAAPIERPWMQAQNGHAHRCLPLNIANAHGWLLLNSTPFIAEWNGGGGLDAIRIQPTGASRQPIMAASHFGNGILTFGVPYLFRTEPGYDLWIGGPTNHLKDGIQALTGIVETDRSTTTFTMNYKFTRPDMPISFAEGEPYCMIYPLKRGLLETVKPEFVELNADKALREAFVAWAGSREQFLEDLQVEGSKAREEVWQKDYFRGGSKAFGAAAHDDHRTKVKLQEFK